MTNEEIIERLYELGYVWDPTWQGYPRWTQIPSGKTILRWAFLTDEEWRQKKLDAIKEAEDERTDS